MRANAGTSGGRGDLHQTFGFDGIPTAHQLMYENKHGHGNMSCLVNATDRGLGRDDAFC